MRIWDRLARLLPKSGKTHDIQGCRAVLPVLRAQLQETVQQVEKSVVSVCSNFKAIADRSRKAVAKTGDLVDGDAESCNATVEQSIETSRITIAGLLERLEHAGNLSAMVVGRMEQIEGTVTGIEALLTEVQKIAFSNKLVALNAKIEAVHVGQLGSGFEVVADEISRQADRSNGLAEDIGQRVREMRDKFNAAAGDLRTFVAEDREKLVLSRNEAEGALNMLLTVHQRARESLSVMASENTYLTNEIANAVVGLQFQDRVSQSVMHVVEALEKLERNLGGSAQPFLVLSGNTTEVGHSLVDDVNAAYTMDSERAVMARALRRTEQAPSEAEVELF